MAWLEENDLNDKWTQVIDSSGEVAGWIDNYNAEMLNLDYHTVETPKRFLTDPYVLEHAIRAQELGLLNGYDLSEIQNVLLVTNIKRRNDKEEMLLTRKFEESLWITNPDMYKAWKEHQAQVAETSFEEAGVEETVPQSVEEFFEALNLFTEGDEVDDHYQEPQEGWLDSVLDDDELSQMGE